MQKLTIVKIGGNVIDEPEKLKQILKKFSLLSGKKILVHGGGKIASEISRKLGIDPKMISGRRITDTETLMVVQMVYAGLLNKNIVAQLQALDCNAIGMSGTDGNSILAHKRKTGDIDYGFAGDVDEVNDELIDNLLKAGLVPVFCALTHDGKGQMLNTNADTIATELATALSGIYEVNLIFVFEKAGVLEKIDDENTLIKKINENHYSELQGKNKILDGMIPKLDNAFRALRKGVRNIYITKWDNPKNSENGGTRVTLEK